MGKNLILATCLLCFVFVLNINSTYAVSIASSEITSEAIGYSLYPTAFPSGPFSTGSSIIDSNVESKNGYGDTDNDYRIAYGEGLTFELVSTSVQGALSEVSEQKITAEAYSSSPWSYSIASFYEDTGFEYVGGLSYLTFSVDYEFNQKLFTTSAGDYAESFVEISLDLWNSGVEAGSGTVLDSSNYTSTIIVQDGGSENSMISGTLSVSGWFDQLEHGGLALNAKSVSIAATKPVPEPATIFLLGSGLLGMLGIKRKQI